MSEWEDYQAYQEMMQELEDSSLTEITQVFAVLSLLVGIPAIAMFWTQNEKMLQFGIAYGAISAIGEVWKAYISSDIIASFMEVSPEVQIIHGWQRYLFYFWNMWNNIHRLAIVLIICIIILTRCLQVVFISKLIIQPSLTITMEIMTSNTETIPGFKITKSLGVATGSTVRAKHIGKDILAGFKNIVGGEIKAYTELLMEARTGKH